MAAIALVKFAVNLHRPDAQRAVILLRFAHRSSVVPSYDGLKDYVHEVIDHSEAYAHGKVHTNGLENFWSLLKRSIRGTYVSVEPCHLFRYLDEQAFRFNHRKLTDAGRFILAGSAILGKRLTFRQLTGDPV